MTCRCDVCCDVPLVEDCSIYVDEAGKNLAFICSCFVLKIVNLIVLSPRYSLHKAFEHCTVKMKKHKKMSTIIANVLLLTGTNL